MAMVKSRAVPRALPASSTAQIDPPSLRTHGGQASRLFSVLAPRWRNELPLAVRAAESLAVFKRRLRTRLCVTHCSMSAGLGLPGMSAGLGCQVSALAPVSELMVSLGSNLLYQLEELSNTRHDCDGAAMQQVRGKVGGDVQLTCKIESTQFKGVYFQRKNLSGEYQIFVNGFYSGQSVDGWMLSEYKPRTSFNRTALSLDFWNLTISDEGDYACYVVPQNNFSPWIATQFHLTVTADYSVPTLTVQESSDRGEGQMSYVLHCSSSGGYPQGNLTWTVSEGGKSHLLFKERSESTTDKPPGVYSISQTNSFNCTKPTNISCSVGGAVSLPLIIFDHQPVEVVHLKAPEPGRFLAWFFNTKSGRVMEY
ncbi:hypothetical protein NFI96_001318 [Prochilodus magdalenae]|nr:hypothetical protein NFI96_001318 [Prochilodus magdalenae]